MERSECPICERSGILPFFELHGVPTQDGAMWPSQEQALDAPAGDIRLAYCTSCGYIWNKAYESKKVQFDSYDFSMQNSAEFQKFNRRLARRLISSFRLEGKTIVDIGCGDGYFLRTICEMGRNNGVGVDPGFTPDSLGLEGVHFLREYYAESHAEFAADLVCCRHVLNAVSDPRDFLCLIRRTMNEKPEPALYLEVPNAEFTFGTNNVWNIAYEHRSWFLPQSIRYLLRLTGFRILRISKCWGKEYLGVEAIRSSVPPSDFPPQGLRNSREMEKILRGFSRKSTSTIATWQRKLDSILQETQNVAVWGAGARAVTLMSLCDFGGVVPKVVDVNSRRQGLYLPRIGYRIDSPDSLKEVRPDAIIVTNARFAGEIKTHARVLGLESRFVIM